MLYISRKLGQSVYLDTASGRATIKLVAFENGQAKIGIEAPQEIRITRDDCKKGERGYDHLETRDIKPA